ncbi:helix-turn-helix domain-containing protein [Marinomonas gallaica]|uniref:helix-turn-helix domain-containing protein n=1 Tax=Marinomonas gallaica TaxID=1806667 RepID=UPI003CE494E4
MTEALSLDIEAPQGDASKYVQAIWLARSALAGEVWLPSDAGTGVTFLIKGSDLVDNAPIKYAYDFQRHSIQSKKLSYSSEMLLFGLRFQPAGFTQLESFGHPLTDPKNLAFIAKKVRCCSDLTDFKKILEPFFDFSQTHDHIADFTRAFIQQLSEHTSLLDALGQIPVSQRQIERHIKHQCGITPKHLERIYRIRHAMNEIKTKTDSTLTQIALECGFSDQSHLVREFKSIVKITPAKYRTLIAAHKR